MRPARSFVWPAGEHDFCLGIGELRALEQRSDAGCFVILTRLLTSQWKIDDVLQPIRLGLIGGGMDEREAQRTIDRALEIASPYSLAVPAATILHSFLMWDEEADQPGELKAATEKAARRSRTEKQDGPSST